MSIDVVINGGDMQERLNKTRNDIMSKMDEAGGDKFINGIKEILYECFLDNPFSEFLIINLKELKGLSSMVSRAEILMKNCYDRDSVSESLILDYIRLKLENEGFYSIFVKDENCIKVKI